MNADEIVKALRLCADKFANCEECQTGQADCPFGETLMDCTERKDRAAADIIESLQTQLIESQRRERAAVEDIFDAALTPCTYCEGNPTNEGICDMQNDHHNMFGCWQWRGLQEAGK